jgi:uncharacterized repeat protein (TIGR01451 family)
MISRVGTSVRAVALLVALLALSAPAAATSIAPASTGAQPKPQPPTAGGRLLACRRSPAITQRVAVVSAWMRPLPAGRRLQLRIDLYQRTTGRWTLRSDVPGLGAWIAPSDPLLGTHAGDVFKYRQSVGRLVVPASYRFRVAFRWLDGGGAVVHTASVTTSACRQPDLRPDLVLDSVDATPSPRGGGLVRYAVTVRNAGRSAAPRAVVAATLPGDTTPNGRQRSVPRLQPGESTVVTFAGPGCAAGGQPASFVADPANAIDEADEANNTIVATCPAP